MLIDSDLFYKLIEDGYVLHKTSMKKSGEKGSVIIEIELEGFRARLMGEGGGEITKRFLTTFASAESTAREYEKLIDIKTLI